MVTADYSYEVHFTSADGKKVAIEFSPDGKMCREL